jgi:hypothetical protein
VAERAAIQWARDTAADLLMPLGQRWAHTVGVVEQARSCAGVLPESEFDVLVAAAYLHDVGYAPELAGTGFHPLDGARFLRQVGRQRLACLVAYHSGARAEAEERGLLAWLEGFPEEKSLFAGAPQVLRSHDLHLRRASSPVGAALRHRCTVRRRRSGGRGDQTITRRAA